MDALRGKTKVTHDRDAVLRHQTDGFKDPLAPFKLHCTTTGLLHQPSGISERFLRRDLIAHEGHIGNHKCMFYNADHSLRVIDHVFERNGDRCVVTLDHVPNRISNEKNIHSRTVKNTCGDRIICR